MGAKSPPNPPRTPAIGDKPPPDPLGLGAPATPPGYKPPHSPTRTPVSSTGATSSSPPKTPAKSIGSHLIIKAQRSPNFKTPQSKRKRELEVLIWQESPNKLLKRNNIERAEIQAKISTLESYKPLQATKVSVKSKTKKRGEIMTVKTITSYFNSECSKIEKTTPHEKVQYTAKKVPLKKSEYTPLLNAKSSLNFNKNSDLSTKNRGKFTELRLKFEEKKLKERSPENSVREVLEKTSVNKFENEVSEKDNLENVDLLPMPKGRGEKPQNKSKHKKENEKL